MEMEKIKAMLDAIKDTDIEEIWIEKNGQKSGFKRKDVVPTEDIHMESIQKNIEPNIKQEFKDEKIIKKDSNNRQIKSPMVGTFMRSTLQGGKPLIEVGDFVSIGQKVCIIEAMKVMKEITADAGGKITKVLIQEGNPVEYGQPLFEIEPQVKAEEKNNV